MYHHELDVVGQSSMSNSSPHLLHYVVALNLVKLFKLIVLASHGFLHHSNALYHDLNQNGSIALHTPMAIPHFWLVMDNGQQRRRIWQTWIEKHNCLKRLCAQHALENLDVQETPSGFWSNVGQKSYHVICRH